MGSTMFEKRLSIANDSDKILEQSDNWNWVRDNACNSEYKR